MTPHGEPNNGGNYLGFLISSFTWSWTSLIVLIKIIYLNGLHLSARGVTTHTLARIQAVSQPDVFGSSMGRRTIVPASSGCHDYSRWVESGTESK
jgi:hypothetical protein